jgi:uncharacterized protein DUF6527
MVASRTGCDRTAPETANGREGFPPGEALIPGFGAGAGRRRGLVRGPTLSLWCGERLEMMLLEEVKRRWDVQLDDRGRVSLHPSVWLRHVLKRWGDGDIRLYEVRDVYTRASPSLSEFTGK